PHSRVLAIGTATIGTPAPSASHSVPVTGVSMTPAAILLAVLKVNGQATTTSGRRRSCPPPIPTPPPSMSALSGLGHAAAAALRTTVTDQPAAVRAARRSAV